MVKEETKFIEELTPEERARLLKERQGVINTNYINRLSCQWGLRIWGIRAI
jgi:hypothetical protein